LALIDAGSEKLPLIKDMEGIVVVTNLLEEIFDTLQMISNLRKIQLKPIAFASPQKDHVF